MHPHSALRSFRSSRLSRHFVCKRCLSGKSMPALFRKLEDGSEQPIEEEDLFRYQRHRWLRDERNQLEMRYRKFNLEALIKRALRARNGKTDGKECVKVTKLLEGDHNKVLLLTMNNSDELIARLPNPIAGPAFYTVASEVATRKFIASTTRVPMPKVLAWDFRADNDVGAEWIIEDKAQGRPLRDVWIHMKRDSQLEVVRQVVRLESMLASVKFLSHGSIYMRRWLSGGSTRYDTFRNVADQILSPKLLKLQRRKNKPGGEVPSFAWNYAIGPSTDRALYEGVRLEKQYCGPFSNIMHYARCMGKNERSNMKNMVWDQPESFQLAQPIESKREAGPLTVRFNVAVRSIAQDLPEDMSTISHPNLSLDNIFINSENKITGVTGWQSTVVSPPLLQRPYPAFLDPANETEAKLTTDVRPRDFYKSLVRKVDPLRYDRLFNHPEERAIRLRPLNYINGVWDAENVFMLRESLIALADYYDREKEKDVFPPDLRFGVPELKRHAREKLALSELQMIFHMIQVVHKNTHHDCPDIPMDGRVRTEDYHKAVDWATRYEKHYMELAGEDEDRSIVHERMWPFDFVPGDVAEDAPHPMIRKVDSIEEDPFEEPRNESSERLELAQMTHLLEKLRRPGE